MNIQGFIKKHMVSLLAIGVSTTSVVVSAAIPGAPGTSGSQGSIGATGPVGPQGSVGDIGPIGPQGSSGVPGQTPFVGSNGNWWIGEVDTGVQAEAEDGIDGEDGSTPYIGSNGNWWIDETDSGITAASGGYSEEMIPYYPIVMTPQETAFLATEENEYLAETLSQADYIQLKLNQGFTPIATASQLLSINTQNGKFILTNHVDISTLPSWAPIHFNGEPFTGFLDGAGYEIRNLTTTNLNISPLPNNFGLFEGLDGATISNLTFKDVNLDLLSKSISGDDAKYVGSLAGIIERSTLENIQLKNVRIVAAEYIGGISAVAGATTLFSSRGQSIEIQGNAFLGSLFGVTDKVMINDVEIVGVSIALKNTLTNSWHGSNRTIGGLIGESYFSSLLHVTLTSLVIQNYNQAAEEEVYQLGGITGESYQSRLMFIVTSGSITLTPNTENFYTEYVGGISGEAYNSEYYDVENYVGISLIMGDSISEMSFRSVGGIVGAGTFVKLERVINYGNVDVIEPTNGFDFCYYANIENCNNEDPFEPEFPIEYFGGLIGYLYGSAYLTHTANMADITSIIEVGGLIGSSGGGGFPFYIQHDVIVQQSFNAGDIQGFGFVGGIMGLTDQQTNLTVVNSYNSGDIFSGIVAGGLVGLAGPSVGVEITLINTYNSGDIIVGFSTAGGLIGATAPTYFGYGFWYQQNWELFLFGNVTIYHSFNVGEIIPMSLDIDNGYFEWSASGSIIGMRLIQTRMYGVSYIQQITEYEIHEWDDNNNMYVPTGEFSFSSPLGVGQGNAIDMTEIPLTGSSFYYDSTSFIYRSAWNFNDIWQWDVNLNLPVLQ